ncbi:hemin uptake protein HemP [Enterobacter cloacae subsp. cloacae]|nr:hemin uptake protein HemP [Enterobacter cloacae subsp. cloacae]
MSRTDNTAGNAAKNRHSIRPADRPLTATLLGDEGRVIIGYDGQRYLLRQTHAEN